MRPSRAAVHHPQETQQNSPGLGQEEPTENQCRGQSLQDNAAEGTTAARTQGAATFLKSSMKCVPKIPVFRRLRQENQEFKGSMMKPCLTPFKKRHLQEGLFHNISQYALCVRKPNGSLSCLRLYQLKTGRGQMELWVWLCSRACVEQASAGRWPCLYSSLLSMAFIVYLNLVFVEQINEKFKTISICLLFFPPLLGVVRTSSPPFLQFKKQVITSSSRKLHTYFRKLSYKIFQNSVWYCSEG